MHTKEVLIAIQELIDQILRFRRSIMSESAKLAQDWVSVQGVATLWLVLEWTTTCISVCWPYGALVACRQVFDSPAWFGAAVTIVCGWRGEPHLLWRSFLVESGIKVTGNLAWACGLAFVVSQGVPGRELMAGKWYSWLSASTTCTRGGLVRTDTTGYTRVCFPSSSIYISAFHTCNLRALLS